MKEQNGSNNDPSGHMWGEIFEKHFPDLLRRALHLCNGNHAAALDLVQNTFVRVLIYSVAPILIANHLGYLLRSLKNQWIDDWRRNRRERELNIRSIDTDRDEENSERFVPRVGPDAMRNLENYDRENKIRKVFKRLADQEKNLLVLHLKGYNCSEIAQITNLDYKKVKHELNKVLTKVRYQLKKDRDH